MDECRNIILQYGVREVTASQVARVLGMMARTHSGLADGIPLQVNKNVWLIKLPSKYDLVKPNLIGSASLRLNSLFVFSSPSLLQEVASGVMGRTKVMAHRHTPGTWMFSLMWSKKWQVIHVLHYHNIQSNFFAIILVGSSAGGS